VAADIRIAQRHTKRRGSKWMGLGNSVEGFEWDYGKDHTLEFFAVDDLVPEYGRSYNKYTYDMGTHDFFICAVDNHTATSEIVIRWGISVKGN